MMKGSLVKVLQSVKVPMAFVLTTALVVAGAFGPVLVAYGAYSLFSGTPLQEVLDTWNPFWMDALAFTMLGVYALTGGLVFLMTVLATQSGLLRNKATWLLKDRTPEAVIGGWVVLALLVLVWAGAYGGIQVVNGMAGYFLDVALENGEVAAWAVLPAAVISMWIGVREFVRPAYQSLARFL